MTTVVVVRDPSMHIIPHNVAITQANLPTRSGQFHTDSASDTENTANDQVKSLLQTEALKLYDLGFNVFPQPIARKSGLPWQRLQYTRLHRDDSQYGLLPLFMGRCNLAVMCGRTSGNLFVIDCETQDIFRHHISQLHSRSIPLWAVETARGGHIYLRCAEGEVANIDQGRLPQTEIKGCRRYVLAPPSVHPTGVLYQWLTRKGNGPPTIHLRDIDWLMDNAGKPIQLNLDRPPRKGTEYTRHPPTHSREHTCLSRSTRDYIANGHALPEGNRNNRLFTAACDMAGNHYSEAETTRILLPVAQASGLPAHEITNTLRSAYNKSRQPAKPQTAPKPPTRQHDYLHAQTYTQHHNWTGRTATSNRAVLLALIERAKHTANENGTFRASIREIAQLARLSTTTTQKAIRRLTNSTTPLIRHAGLDKTSGAQLWQFTEHTIREGKALKTDTLSPPPHWLSGSVSLFNSDLVERGALGWTGLALYQVMLALGRPAMPSVLADRALLKVYQVNYALSKLKKFGLVVRERVGWAAVRVGDDFLVRGVSALAGTLGKGEARRRRHADERAIYSGRQILLERYKREGRALWAVGVSSGSVCEEARVSVDADSGSGVRFWRCPNCGQMLFGDLLPDLCEGCHDLTTWREVSGVPEGSDVEDDPVLALALELGGVLKEGDKVSCSESRFLQ